MNIICAMYNVLKYTQLFFLLATHTHFGKRIVSIELRVKLLGYQKDKDINGQFAEKRF